MDFNLIEALGLAAGFCTTIAFVPQVARVYRRRSADDLSMPMLAVFTAGVVLWLCYGFAARSTAVVVANTCTLALTATLLALCMRYRRVR